MTDQNRLSHWLETAESLSARFAERAPQHDRDNTFPFADFADLREAGFLALTIPRDLGGLGATPWETSQVLRVLARGSAATALALNMHLIVVGKQGEIRTWPEPLRRQVMADVVERGALVNTIHSEPDLGSPARGALPTTTATRTPDGWRIDGRKSWASLAPALGWMIVLATLVDDGPRRRGNLLVRAGAPGITMIETWDTLGMRATASHDLLFDGVEVPADALLPEETTDIPGAGAAWGALGGPSVYLGVGTAALDAAARWASTRVPNGMTEPISTLLQIQQKLGEMEILLWQGRNLLDNIARRWEEHPEERASLPWELAAMKHTISNNVIRVTDLAMRVVGSAALGRDLPLERYLRDARGSLNQPPIDDMTLSMVAKAVLERLSAAGKEG